VRYRGRDTTLSAALPAEADPATVTLEDVLPLLRDSHRKSGDPIGGAKVPSPAALGSSAPPPPAARTKGTGGSGLLAAATAGMDSLFEFVRGYRDGVPLRPVYQAARVSGLTHDEAVQEIRRRHAGSFSVIRGPRGVVVAPSSSTHLGSRSEDAEILDFLGKERAAIDGDDAERLTESVSQSLRYPDVQAGDGRRQHWEGGFHVVPGG